MKNITIEGGIYLNTEAGQWGDSEYKFFGGKCESWDKYIAIAPYTIAFDLPAYFDPRSAQVKALEKQRDELHAKFALAVTEINARINSLLAIEGAATETAP